MKKILALTLTIIMTCTALGSCGETAQQSAESKAATTTTTTATETTTAEAAAETPSETEATTTTETKVDYTTTTTTEVIETSETEPETTKVDEPNDNGVYTMKVDMTATMTRETDEPKDPEMMTVEDCIKKIVKDNIGEDVVSIELNEKQTYFMITTDNGTSIVLIARDIINEYNSGELVNYNSFSYSINDNGTDAIFYSDI